MSTPAPASGRAVALKRYRSDRSGRQLRGIYNIVSTSAVDVQPPDTAREQGGREPADGDSARGGAENADAVVGVGAKNLQRLGKQFSSRG